MKKTILLLCLFALVLPVYGQNNDIFVFGGSYDQSRFDEHGYTHHSYAYPDRMRVEDLGTLTTEASAQIGFGFIYARTLNDRLAVEFGYETFGNDLDVISTFVSSIYSPEGDLLGGTVTGDLSTGEIKNSIWSINGRYTFTNPEAKFRLYGVIGAGFNIIHMDAQGTAYFPEDDIFANTQTIYPLRVKADGFNSLTFNLGVGGDVALGESFALTFDIRHFYSLNNETVIWHVMPGQYSDLTGESVLDIGCTYDDDSNVIGCENYNLAAQYDAWFDYSINYKPSFFRGVVGIKFMF